MLRAGESEGKLTGEVFLSIKGQNSDSGGTD